MTLKVLCAGCSREERDAAESDVRRALGPRAAAEPWQVSLVKLQNRWSVTLDGPGARAVTCLAPEGKLSETIRDALGGAPAAPVAAGPVSGGRRDRHACAKCGGAFFVVYEVAPGEPETTVAVACPHCWHINRAPVSESAAESQDFRAETA